jgi:hypothetical protein
MELMADISWHEDAAKQARVLQVIVGAMATGAIFFLAVALTTGSSVKWARPTLPIPLTLIAVFLVGVGLIARFLYLYFMTGKACREIANGTYQPVGPAIQMAVLPAKAAGGSLDPDRDAKCLLSVFQLRTIASAAMFEGWGFFATIAYLVEGGPINVALAVILILGVAAHFPTRSRTIAWVQRQLELLEVDRVAR